jgi:hypothetical protein
MATRDEILAALTKLGVERAGSLSDAARWSVSDLATDLADELAGRDAALAARERAACLKAMTDCDCQRTPEGQRAMRVIRERGR